MKSSSRDTPGGSRKAAGYVYREAARQIERADCPAPLAVKRVEGKGFMEDSQLVDKLRSVYASESYPYWPWTIERNRRDLRVLALCFMAAMVEAGDA